MHSSDGRYQFPYQHPPVSGSTFVNFPGDPDQTSRASLPGSVQLRHLYLAACPVCGVGDSRQGVYPPFRDEKCQDWQIEERPCFVWLDRSLWFGDGRWLHQRWKPASDVCLRYRGNVTCRNFDGIFGQLMTQLFFRETQILKASDGSEIHEFILRWTSWKWKRLLSHWQVACLSKLLGCPNSWKHLEQPDGPGDFPKVRNRTRAPHDFTPGVLSSIAIQIHYNQILNFNGIILPLIWVYLFMSIDAIFYHPIF